ncbi:hypothetical protein K523DRAFT_367297 [Schizophyllum commune Tattone D]|nr:hypothetical protein K523DRAFT_367297 [Schizophyllum commune Tattone D]
MPPRGTAAARPMRAMSLARPTTRGETRAHTRSALMALADVFGCLADDHTSAPLLSVAMVCTSAIARMLAHQCIPHGILPRFRLLSSQSPSPVVPMA